MNIQTSPIPQDLPDDTGQITHLTPTPQQIRDARAVVANPHPHDRPGLRLLAWAILKAMRGQTIHQHRLQAGAPQADRQVA